MSNVISFERFKKTAVVKAVEKDPHIEAYVRMLRSMDKLQLMEEMVRFQEERSRKGHLTLDLIHKGIPLFEILERAAETDELRVLTRSYSKHLKYELLRFKEGGDGERHNPLL